MAIARDTTVANIKPLQGAIVRRYTAGAAVIPGELVSMQADGKVDPTNTTSSAMKVAGVALPNGTTTAFADGDRIDVVVFGPVNCVTGGTPGATLFGTNTAGEPGESAGSNVVHAGWVETATIVFINPNLVA